MGCLKGTELQKVIISTLTLLIDNNIDVCAISCDQGSPNRTAYKQLNVTTENPFISILNCKIFCLFDIVHLIKSVRNNLLVTNILIGDEIISWSVLVKIFESDNGLIRAMHKLTEAHIKPDTFQKMRAKLATQVFSHHVASAMLAAAATNIFEEKHKPMVISTATFFMKINKLFDHMNSICKYAHNPDKCALSDENDIVEFLKESVNWISSWKKENKGVSFCFSGLTQTLNGVLGLWKHLKSEKQLYLITSHLNSDALENTISVIRNNHGSYEKNHSAFRLHKNIKQMCFYNICTSDISSYNDSEVPVLLNMNDVEGLQLSRVCNFSN